ncbi:hypothetical protein PROFUN_05107 [Planoprotostelium fungivorum]|uniref:EGF-like domain-containing protein n=1 Tax=Planoprotostelium fungivorum TaxID=1890364 RepID=A0A2P6NRX5_9EUKA|nr:hypothetical protein PROFUN_05107 [Planoprotostelium fungivorum]
MKNWAKYPTLCLYVLVLSLSIQVAAGDNTQDEDPWLGYLRGLSSPLYNVEEVADNFYRAFDMFTGANLAILRDQSSSKGIDHDEQHITRHRVKREEYERPKQRNSPEMDVESHKVTIQKRDSTEEGDKDPTCSSVGYVYYTEVTRNTCKGRLCNLYKIKCDKGTYVSSTDGKWTEVSGGNQTIQMTDIYSNCRALELSCSDRIVDMNEQFHMTDVKIESFLCEDMVIINKTSPGNLKDAATCLARVYGDNYTIFGYDYYGYPCESEALYCKDKKVDVSDGKPIDATDCQNVCHHDADNREKIQVLCDGRDDKVDGCQVERPKVACGSKSSIGAQCKIKTMNCSGISIDLHSYSGPYTNCTVSQLECGTSQSVSPQGTCNLPDQFQCDNKLVYRDQYKGNISDCILSHLDCKDNQGGCTFYQPACTEGPSCTLYVNYQLIENSTSCNRMVRISPRPPLTLQINDSLCLCPEDRHGSSCEKQVDYKCEPEMVVPVKDCSNPWLEEGGKKEWDKLEGDPACLVFPLASTVVFRYRFDCYTTMNNTGYTAPGNITIGGQQISIPPPPGVSNPYNFTYWLDSEKLKSTFPLHWNAEFRIYDFNRFTRSNISTIPEMNKDQISGTQTVDHSVVLSQIPDRFWAGNRLYYELLWNEDKKNRPVQNGNRGLDRGFIDCPEHQTPAIPSTNRSRIITYSIFAGVILLAVLAFIGVYLWRRRDVHGEYQRLEDTRPSAIE